MRRFTLSKAERLSGERRIERLFGEGTGGFIWPFRYVVQSVASAAEPPGAAVLVSVSKRNHKTAVARNLLKRRTREAYRLNKAPIADKAVEKQLRVSLGLVYASKEITDFQTIEHAVKKIIATVSHNL